MQMQICPKNIMTLRIYTILSFIILSGIYSQTFAQQHSFDSCYVTACTRTNVVQGYVGAYSRKILFTSLDHQNRQNDVFLSPNSSAFLGVTGNYKRIALYAEVIVPNTSKVSNQMSSVRGFALFANHFTPRWGVTAFVNYNRGLLMMGNQVMPYFDRNDLRAFTIGAHHYTVLQPRCFSLSAANGGAYLQTQSKGSFMLLTTPAIRTFSSSQSIIPEDIIRYHFTEMPINLKSLSLYGIQVKPGYVYNYVRKKGHIFSSAALYAGLGTDFHQIITDSGKHRNVNLNLGYRAKFVVGTNSNKWVFTAELLTDRTQSYLCSTLLVNQYYECSLNLGYRF
jgi:Domain of unknown function (DUF4421)